MNTNKLNLQDNKYHFLAHGGEMGKLTREVDCAATPLGVPETWSLSLRNNVAMVLRSQFPMLVFWGP